MRWLSGSSSPVSQVCRAMQCRAAYGGVQAPIMPLNDLKAVLQPDLKGKLAVKLLAPLRHSHVEP